VITISRRCRRGLAGLLALASAALSACSDAGARADPLAAIPELPFTVEQRVPHDSTLFTQGIAFAGDLLVESGGGYRESRLVLRRLEEPHALRTVNLPPRWFAEGIAAHAGRLFLLTWREGVAQSFSLPELEPGPVFEYPGEGWGLASDGSQLIQSDGSNVLAWRDPQDFTVTRRLAVHAGGIPLTQLNELEWIDGWIVANVWLSDYVVGIDPASGCVRWKLALEKLLDRRERRQADVLNGVAWEPDRRRLWVTGKRWPWLFGLRVDLPPPPGASAGGRCS
jgi:glutamine cyclotransferase